MAKDKSSRSSRRKQQPNKSNGGGWKKWLKYILIGIATFLVVGLIAGAGLFTYYAADAPELTQDDLYGSYASDLVDKNGDVFYTLGGQNREQADTEEYPQILKDAVIATEDQRFYDHPGVDPIGIGRAAWGNLTNEGIVGGGSTITQQLIKLSVFSTKESDQTLERKAQEAWLAVQLEQELSKDQILNLYMNKVHMGGNVYGMATAAQEYYGKHVSELELHEAALLAGMPQAPNAYNPYSDPEAAKNRRDTVLYTMADYGAITEQEAQQAFQVPIEEGLQEPEESTDENTMVFDSYITAVLEEVEAKTDLDPYTAGLTIQTNMDPEAQQLAYDVTHTDEYVNFPDEELQTAVSMIDSNTGQISAVIGGRNQDGHLSYNRALNMNRSIGSVIKPLTVYAPAIEFNQYSTYHQVVDEPYQAPGTDWELSNWDGEYNGQMTMREALVESRNIPAAKIFNEDLNMDEVAGFLEGIGINPETLSSGSGGLVPSNAIDGVMTPMQLAGAFSAFSNEGVYTEPYAVSSVTTQDGEEIDLTPESNRAMEESTAYMVTDMLKGVTEDYYSESLDVPGVNHAGKTGTTNYTQEQHEEHNIPSEGVPDSWFAGYSPNYSISVWAGYDQQFEEGNYLTNEDGSRGLPRDIYREILTQLSEGNEGDDWEMPDSVSEEEVVNGSTPPQSPSPSTPESDIITELFVEGNLPEPAPAPEQSEEESESSEESGTEEEDTEEQPEEDTEENTEEESVSLNAPSGLSATYDENSGILRASWDPVDAGGGSVSYVVTINGNSSTVSSPSISLTQPPTGQLSISVAAQVDGQTGPTAQTSVNVPGGSGGDSGDGSDGESQEEQPAENEDSGGEEEQDTEQDESEGGGQEEDQGQADQEQNNDQGSESESPSSEEGQQPDEGNGGGNNETGNTNDGNSGSEGGGGSESSSTQSQTEGGNGGSNQEGSASTNSGSSGSSGDSGGSGSGSQSSGSSSEQSGSSEEE